MITTVVFDIGNVLMLFDWMPYIDRMVPDKDTQNKINQILFFSGLWNRLDRGEICLEELFKSALSEADDCENEMRAVLDNMEESLIPHSYACSWVKEVKAMGMRVPYLSNYSTEVMERVPECFTFMDETDGGVISCDVGCVKPDEKIFNIFLEKFSLSPEECIFIDDTAANIKTADEVGFKTIHFRNYEQADNELKIMINKENLL